MQVQKLDSQKYTPSFGTYLGLELQEKVILAKNRGMFSKKQLANLEKIEDDGILASLDLYKKFIIKKQNNKKGTMVAKKILILKDGTNKVDIADLSHVFEPVPNTNRVVFHINRFLSIFNDEFNLPQKIQQAWEKLSQASH